MNNSPSIAKNIGRYPPEFQQVLQAHSLNFVGRGFVFTAISNFLQRYDRGYFTIVGTPGSGKSAILAKYVRDNPQVTALPSVMSYKNPTPNPLPASDEGAMMYLITKESAVSITMLKLLAKIALMFFWLLSTPNLLNRWRNYLCNLFSSKSAISYNRSQQVKRAVRNRVYTGKTHRPGFKTVVETLHATSLH